MDEYDDIFKTLEDYDEMTFALFVPISIGSRRLSGESLTFLVHKSLCFERGQICFTSGGRRSRWGVLGVTLKVVASRGWVI